MPNNLLEKVIYISNEDYETLVSAGTVEIGGKTLTYDENIVYITPEKAVTITEDGLMSAEDKAKLDTIESGAQVNVQADWNQTDTTADDYIKNKPEVDTDFSLTSTNALQNKVISEKLDYIDYALTHIKYKLFGVTTLSEIDYKVDYATIYPIPETLSDEDGTHRVVYSDTQLKEVEGNSVAFNQLFNHIRENATTNGITLVNNNDGSYTFNGTATADIYLGFSTQNTFRIIAGHKYLLKGLNNVVKYESPTVRGYINSPYVEWRSDKIWSAESSSSSDQTLWILIMKDTAVDNLIVRPQIFDLTLMGLDSITSVEEFTRLFPLTYYPYNAGEIKSVKISKIESWGYNLFDGELEQGAVNNSTGIKEASSSAIRTKNYIKVIGGQTYTLEQDNFVKETNYSARILYKYDSSYNYLGFVNMYNTNTTILDNNCCYVLFAYAKSGITIPTDPQIAIHNASVNLGYKPYVGKLGIINLPNAPITLNCVNSVKDTLRFEEQENGTYNAIITRRVGVVDLGTFDWSRITTDANARFVANIPNIKRSVSGTVAPNLLCILYKTDGWNNVREEVNANNIISVDLYSDYVGIVDNSYTDATTFKQAMSGVMLYYELATPTETTLATDLTFEEVSAIIEQGGSIETVFENVPPNLKTAFVVNKVIVS